MSDQNDHAKERLRGLVTNDKVILKYSYTSYYVYTMVSAYCQYYIVWYRDKKNVFQHQPTSATLLKKK